MPRAVKKKASQAKPSAGLRDWYRSTGKRWLRNTLVTLFALAVFIPGLGLLKQRLEPENLPIHEIEIRGDLKRVDVASVKALVGPLVSGGVMRVDVHRLAQMIDEQPWVERAWVRTRWPDTLEIQIAAHEPVARWGESQWLDLNGNVFTGSDQPDQGQFPVLHGPEGLAPRVLNAYRLYRDQLAEIDVQLEELILDERRAWRLSTEPNMTIELGRQAMDRRLRRFVSVYPKQLVPVGAAENKRIVQADLRYPHGLAVLWESLEPAQVVNAETAEKG